MTLDKVDFNIKLKKILLNRILHKRVKFFLSYFNYFLILYFTIFDSF